MSLLLLATEGPPRVIELRLVIIITTIYELRLLREAIWLHLLGNCSVWLWEPSNIDHDDRCLLHLLLHVRLLLIEKVVVVLRTERRKRIDSSPRDQPLAIPVSDAILQVSIVRSVVARVLSDPAYERQQIVLRGPHSRPQDFIICVYIFILLL